jgi:hypothetical protein
MKCKKHPRYQAKRRKRTGCLKCRLMWALRRWIRRPATDGTTQLYKTGPSY